VKLSHLKTACYLYTQFTEYNSSYVDLFQAYPHLDLSEERQVKSLLQWLRSWGCRQFNIDDECMSVRSIMDWYRQHKSELPSREECLEDYDLAKNRALISSLFSELSNGEAGTKKHKKGSSIDVRIGPVGAAKTLFALRPNLFSPWDTPIYRHFSLKGDGDGYVSYLTRIQGELKEIKGALKEASIPTSYLFDNPKNVHRSFPKLVDEYYWVTITKGCDPEKIEGIFR